MRRRKSISTLGLIAELLRQVDRSNSALVPKDRLNAAIDVEDILYDLTIHAVEKRRECQSGGISGKMEVTS